MTINYFNFKISITSLYWSLNIRQEHICFAELFFSYNNNDRTIFNFNFLPPFYNIENL